MSKCNTICKECNFLILTCYPSIAIHGKLSINFFFFCLKFMVYSLCIINGKTTKFGYGYGCVGNLTEIPTCVKQTIKKKHTPNKTIICTRQYLRGSVTLPTSTELQEFHYYQGKIQSATTIFTLSQNTATPPTIKP